MMIVKQVLMKWVCILKMFHSAQKDSYNSPPE